MRQERGAGNVLILLELLIFVFVLGLGITKSIKEPEITEEWDQPEQNGIQTAAETETVSEPTEETGQQTPVFSEEILTKVQGMTVEEKTAHLFLTSPESLTDNGRVTIAGDGTRTALEQYPVSGLVYHEDNFQGRSQFGALVSGAQRYSLQESGEYLFLAAGNVSEEGRETVAVSSVYDAGFIVEFMASGMSQNDAGRMVYPVLFPENAGAINRSVPYIMLENTENETYTDENARFCSVSAEAVNSIRNDYQYQGVIISGNLSEPSVAEVYPNGTAAVKALQAGADLIFQTDGFTEAYGAVLAAVNSGEITQERLDEAVCRILTLKAGMPKPTDGDILGN